MGQRWSRFSPPVWTIPSLAPGVRARYPDTLRGSRREEVTCMYHREQDDKILTRLIWIRGLAGALLRFAVIVAWELITASTE